MVLDGLKETCTPNPKPKTLANIDGLTHKHVGTNDVTKW